MPTSSKSTTGPAKLSSIEINPVIVIVSAVLLVLGLGWFFWLRPQMATDKAARDWTTPEAAAARSPENRPKNATHEAAVQQLLQNEGRSQPRHRSRRESE
jgi:hypothetical protein